MTEYQEWGVSRNLAWIERRADSVFELWSRKQLIYPKLVKPGDQDYEFLVRTTKLEPGQRCNIHYDLTSVLEEAREQVRLDVESECESEVRFNGGKLIE